MARQDVDDQHDRKLTGKGKERGKQKRGRRTADEAMELSLVDWLVLDALCATAMAEGGAVRVGFTRDGGALAIGVYVGDEYGTEYVRPNEPLADACAEICEAWFNDGGSRFQERIERLEEALAAYRKEAAGTPA